MPEASKRIVVVGGGAAGFFAAIAAAENNTSCEVLILEKGPHFLQKVRISGGGRCNVMHSCFDVRELVTRYPRGERELIGPFTRFGPNETRAWFEERGVRLKTEPDGRMFPVTDKSQTIIDCLIQHARNAGVQLKANTAVERISVVGANDFRLELANKETLCCRRLLLATGGSRTLSMAQLASALGHTIEPPVPSLFTFHLDAPWLTELAGVSVSSGCVSVPGTTLKERGPILVTHWGLSGPAILRLSAWGARTLHGFNYQFPLCVNWTNAEDIPAELARERSPRTVTNTPLFSVPSRLWQALVKQAGISDTTRWSNLSKQAQQTLGDQLTRTELRVTGKSLNKDEFVTCGGVRLSEINFKTMESRIIPGLHFAGEVLDVDGITGGFNFQAAWTTGWLAGQAMAARI